MRILFLGLNYAPEQVGIGLYSSDMCQAWARMGYEVHAVVAVPYYPAWKTFEGFTGRGWVSVREEDVAVTRCPIYVPRSPTGIRRIIHHASFFCSSILPLMNAARRNRPDIVFTVAPSLIAAPAAWLVARLSGAKCWLHIQDLEVEAMLATGLIKRGIGARLAARFEQLVLKLFDQLSSISPQMCRKLVEKGVDLEKTCELRNWADLEGVRPLEGPSPYRDEWGIGDRHVALYSGNIANKQGIDIIVDAARLLKNRQDVIFVICGEGPHRAKLQQAASDLGNIQFRDLQPRERLGELLGMATVHLLPQVAAAADLLLPSKLTNMLASGRPVVATAAKGTSLALEVEGCGVVTPPGDVTAFARAIAHIVDDPQLACKLSAAARQRAEERWAKGAILEHAARRMSWVLERDA